MRNRSWKILSMLVAAVLALILTFVLMGAIEVLKGGGGEAPVLEQRQALRGEGVVNGEVLCDSNPQTPTPWCYFIPVTPFMIDGEVGDGQ